MQKMLQDFLEHMAKHDAAPSKKSDIKADNERRYYAIEGDKGSRKSGAYCLKIENDFGVGWFINYRYGETIKWHSSQKNDTRSPAEKAAWKAKIEAEKAKKALEEEKLSHNAAKKAQEIWADAVLQGEHPYLKRKKIGLNGARIQNQNIVVPAQNKEGEIRTVQRINPKGEKFFIKDSEKKGCFFKVGFSDEFSEKIIICEGFSTGCTLYEVMKSPVVVAFDSGNLQSVLGVIRKKYPTSEIIIAADNDAWLLKQKFKPKDIDPKEIPATDERWETWQMQGYIKNAGIESAKKAAKKYENVRIVIPRFSDVSSKPTDFNDLFCLEGEEAVRKIFLTKVEEDFISCSSEEIPEWLEEIPWPEDEESRAVVELYNPQEKREVDSDWKSKLYLTEKGNLIGNSLHNTMLYIENDSVLSQVFCFDEFSCEKMVYQCPPWNSEKDFRPRSVNDEDITCLAAYLERYGIKAGMQNVARCLNAAVKKNPKNPAKEYFTKLKWDGVKRLDNWLRDFCGCVKEDPQYISAIGRKWLCASVKRVFEPGTKFDHMLILEGEQGTGKSTLLKELATIHGTPYFDDTIDVPSIGTKDTISKFQGVLIVEIAELAGLQKKDVNELKNQITITDDRKVLKFENEATVFPRKFVFAGTINPMDGYLSDPTGNRRFWPVTTTELDVKGLKVIKEQLWAEAKDAVVNGEKLYLDKELTKKAESIARARTLEHPWFSEIDNFVSGHDIVEKESVWNTLSISDRTKWTPYAANEISKIMTKLGYESKQIREAGTRRYVWKKKEAVEDYEEVNF